MATSARSPEFNLTFEGPALEDGSMAVADLAPALLALGEIFHEANAVLDPARPPVSLEIRAFSPGSFEILLSLGQLQGISQELIQLLSGHDTTALSNLITLITAPGVGLFAVIMYIRRHNPIKRENPEPGTTRFVAPDGTFIDVPTAVATLAERVTIRRNAQKVVVPLTRPGVERMRFESADKEPMEVEASEADAYDVRPVEAQTVTDQVTEMALTVVVLSFTKGRRWRFNDGRGTFPAAMLDENFIRRIENNEESFRRGDLIRCRVHFTQVQTETGVKPTYEVLEVLQHIPALGGLPLPLTTGEAVRQAPLLTKRDPILRLPSPESGDKD
jgi:hypothetical protein